MYKVLAALRRDANEGHVRLTKGDFAHRSVIRIKNKSEKKVVYCECLEIDDNFFNEYNQKGGESINKEEKTIVINKWYRTRLGEIATKEKYDLQITSANCLWGKFRACTLHPQIVIRLPSWLAAISVGLGLLSIGLGILSIFLSLKCK